MESTPRAAVTSSPRREEGREETRSLPPLDARSLAGDLARAIEGEVRFDAGSRGLYATDASNYRAPPLGVVLPRTIDDVCATVEICREHGAPLLSRGGGTSLAGQCCNVAVVMDFSKYLNRVLEVDPASRTARVQPGVVCDDLRAPLEKEHGLLFGPDPSTHAWCTLGGMIGNNSCGVHSVMTGKTSDCVRELEVLTYRGKRLRVGPTDDVGLRRLASDAGDEGRIYRELLALRDDHAAAIRERFPDIPRRVSGYNLDELLPERGFDVARALVGSEGTCVTVLEATVSLVTAPGARALVLLGYPDVASAADDVPRVLAHGPIGLEGIDGRLVEFMRKKHLHERDLGLLPEGDGWLLVELGGESPAAAERAARQLADETQGAPASVVVTDPRQQARVWSVRESGLGATARVPGMNDTHPGWEDAAVPPARLGDYLREFRSLLDRFGYDGSLYGHFGDGCVHCRIDFDLGTEEGVRKWREFLDEAADLVVSYGGSLSGEHGDGKARSALLPRMFGSDLVEAFRRFKSIWDPDGRMNPGRIADPEPPDSGLRLGPEHRPRRVTTSFQYGEDEGSFERAVTRCVGVGKCRRSDDAFMCPSYLVTRDERDSTRGRARLLFEMLQGDVVRDGWRSDAVREALDLCLGCKGCKKECPVDVDLAKYKSEFLARHYRGRIRPRSFGALGLIGWWARLGALAPGIANALAPRLRRLAGVSSLRTLPRFAHPTFHSWFRRRAPETGGDGKRPVVLYPDPFHDFFDPAPLRAAVEVLEAVGCTVRTTERRPPALRPLIHYGFLGLAKRAATRALRVLRPALEEGVPIVAIEPSTVAVYRDELRSLLPGDAVAEAAAREVRLLSELLESEDVRLPEVEPGRAVLHTHCHQKAVLDGDATRRVLERIGLHCDQPEPGCCGMAGSFGLEENHADLSRRIAERKLWPAVRDAGRGDWIVADGFSCRSQIRDGTDRTPLHSAQVLACALHHRNERQGGTTCPNATPS